MSSQLSRANKFYTTIDVDLYRDCFTPQEYKNGGQSINPGLYNDYLVLKNEPTRWVEENRPACPRTNSKDRIMKEKKILLYKKIYNSSSV